MAADTQGTSGSGLPYPQKKIHRIATDTQRALIGCTGGIFDCMTFVEWFRAGADREHIPRYEQEDMVALVLQSHGLYLYDWQGVGVSLPEGMHAIGTGSAVALAAMRYEIPPQEAVRMACSVDVYSGEPVEAFDLGG